MSDAANTDDQPADELNENVLVGLAADDDET